VVALWGEDVRKRRHLEITWEIEPVATAASWTVTRRLELREGANNQLYGGWPMIPSGLKTCSRPAACSPHRVRSCTA